MFLALIGLIPGLLSFAQGIAGKILDAKVKMLATRIGADENVARQMILAAAEQDHETTSRLQALVSHPLTMWLIVIFALPFALYCWKIVVVDIIIGPGCIWFTSACWIGNTDPIRGQVADWATTIIACLFGSSTVLAAGRMYFGRDKTGE
jgi:hypothetical protein